MLLGLMEVRADENVVATLYGEALADDVGELLMVEAGEGHGLQVGLLAAAVDDVTPAFHVVRLQADRECTATREDARDCGEDALVRCLDAHHGLAQHVHVVAELNHLQRTAWCVRERGGRKTRQRNQ